MKTKVATIQPTQFVSDALDLFERYQIHHLPVVSTTGKLEGIISSTDIIKAFTLHFASTPASPEAMALEDLTVKDLMSTSVLTIEPDDTIGLAADIFLSNQLHALPIIDDGMLVGIITSHDLLDYAYKDHLGEL